MPLSNNSAPAVDVAVYDTETSLNEENVRESMFHAGMTMEQLDKVTSELMRAYDGERDERNRRHGQGSFTSARTGNSYEGTYHNDKKHGHGVMVFHNGDMYDGMYVSCRALRLVYHMICRAHKPTKGN